MPRQYKPTMEEYEQISRQLEELRLKLMYNNILMSNKMGKTKVRSLYNYKTIENNIRKLRSQVENIIHNDYPDDFDINMVYGGRHLHEPYNWGKSECHNDDNALDKQKIVLPGMLLEEGQ